MQSRKIISSKHHKTDRIMLGTNLLVKIFDAFAIHNTQQKTFRRLYCESGQAGIKSYRFVNESTRTKLEQIIPKCKDCKHHKLRHVTMVLIFEELVNLKELELLKESYTQIGGPSKYAYKLCNKKTQRTIQKLGLT